MLDGRVLTEDWFHGYELDKPREPWINHVFNFEDLTPYRVPINYPPIIPDPSLLTAVGPQHFPIHPPSPRRHQADKTENIMQDAVISTADGGHRFYLVCWKGRPDFPLYMGTD